MLVCHESAYRHIYASISGITFTYFSPKDFSPGISKSDLSPHSQLLSFKKLKVEIRIEKKERKMKRKQVSETLFISDGSYDYEGFRDCRVLSVVHKGECHDGNSQVNQFPTEIDHYYPIIFSFLAFAIWTFRTITQTG